MSGCDRCEHRKKDHLPLCIVLLNNRRMCLCPVYLKPGTMRLSTPPDTIRVGSRTYLAGAGDEDYATPDRADHE